jgi:hypothetical protein
MKTILIGCSALVVILMGASLTSEQTAPLVFDLDSRLGRGVSWPFLLNNLETYFFVEYSKKADSNLYPTVIEKFSVAVAKLDSKYRDRKWSIGHQFWLKSMPHLIFLEASDNRAIDAPPFDIVFDKRKDSLYLLNYMTKEQVAELIPPSEFALFLTPSILDYCRLFALLKNPASSIRFLSCIDELLLGAIYWQPQLYDLDNVREFDTGEIEMPSIKGMARKPIEGLLFTAKDTIDISFYMAKNDELVNVKMRFSRNSIIDYKERVTGKTLDWNSGGRK